MAFNVENSCIFCGKICMLSGRRKSHANIRKSRSNDTKKGMFLCLPTDKHNVYIHFPLLKATSVQITTTAYNDIFF